MYGPLTTVLAGRKAVADELNAAEIVERSKRFGRQERFEKFARRARCCCKGSSNWSRGSQVGVGLTDVVHAKEREAFANGSDSTAVSPNAVQGSYSFR
jgi:hypothetical protein